MLLINCEINLTLTWSVNCVIVFKTVINHGATFAIADTKVYVPVVTLLSQGIVKLLNQLKSGFKGTFKPNKYQSKAIIQAQNQYLDYLIRSYFRN